MEPFDQTTPEAAEDRGSNWQSPDNRKAGYGLVIGTIVGAWVLFFLAPFSLLLLPLSACAIFYLVFQRRYLGAVAIAALSPVTVFFCFGIGSYFMGNAIMMGMGPAGRDYRNLDPVVRCSRTTGGCFPCGNEWARILPNNLAVRSISSLLGPMPGGYQGAYPDEKKAKQLITNGAAVKACDVYNGRFSVDGVEVVLDKGVGKELLDSFCFYDVKWSKGLTLAAAIYKEDCVILRIPNEPFEDPAKCAATIVLIGRERGRPFAYYYDGYAWVLAPEVYWDRPDEDR